MPKMLRSHRSDRIPFDESTESRHNTDPTLPRRQENIADGDLRNWIPRWPTRSELILKILIITSTLILFEIVITCPLSPVRDFEDIGEMKNQQVNVDYWAMGKAMCVYIALTAMCWLMLRLFNMIFMLPRRLRAQHQNIQQTLEDLQKRFPNLNITEEDLKNAEKELEDFVNEENKQKEAESDKEINTEAPQAEESKKTI
ncbi:hypothetical protein evm_009497 [Chilo suppressalis]|nr:hypothetical protein evm_009497 [Chilo suppressalis]